MEVQTFQVKAKKTKKDDTKKKTPGERHRSIKSLFDPQNARTNVSDSVNNCLNVLNNGVVKMFLL